MAFFISHSYVRTKKTMNFTSPFFQRLIKWSNKPPPLPEHSKHSCAHKNFLPCFGSRTTVKEHPSVTAPSHSPHTFKFLVTALQCSKSFPTLRLLDWSIHLATSSAIKQDPRSIIKVTSSFCWTSISPNSLPLKIQHACLLQMEDLYLRWVREATSEP